MHVLVRITINCSFILTSHKKMCSIFLISFYDISCVLVRKREYHIIFLSIFNACISADPLECPSGTLAYGMTLFIPESVYWRDPDLGPPPISNAPMPVSVCLLCGRITEIHREGNREFETLSPTSTEIRNLPSYQVCIGKGQTSTVEFL